MADKMDRGLDEIIADGVQRPSPAVSRFLPSALMLMNASQRSNDARLRRPGPGDRRRERQDNYGHYPRDGVRKPARNEPRGIDSDWVHDRYEENNSRRAPAPRRRRESPPRNEPTGSKIRVENLHYDLTQDDLNELFMRIGPVSRLELLYDRAGRSDGTAYVTYEYKEDALEAIRQFDGANANGQPIRLTLMPTRPSRNPFDTAVMPSRPLADRVSLPSGISRSLSPRRRYDGEDATRKGIDRYIPGTGSRPRSPVPPRRGGRRPGARREAAARDQQNSRGGRANLRSKKTQEELDAEMEDYFGANSNKASASTAEALSANGTAAAAGTVAAAGNDDIDMIE